MIMSNSQSRRAHEQARYSMTIPQHVIHLAQGQCVVVYVNESYDVEVRLCLT